MKSVSSARVGRWNTLARWLDWVFRFRDIRVRHAINYCVNRDGLVTLLNGLAEPAYGLFKKADPFFGNPKQQYTYDPAKGKALLKEAEFIVVSRPGFSLADVADSLPKNLRPNDKVVQALKKQQAAGDIVTPHYTIHLMGDLHEKASATQVRSSAEARKALGKSVPPAVAEYIKKVGLYRK